MTPTDAQIEAAAKAMFDQQMPPNQNWNDLEDWREAYLEMAKAALTAAAEVDGDAYDRGCADTRRDVRKLILEERERCARRVETYPGCAHIAADLRGMGDE